MRGKALHFSFACYGPTSSQAFMTKTIISGCLLETRADGACSESRNDEKKVGQRLRELIQGRETNFGCSNSFISICFVHNARYNSNNSYKSAAPILHHHMIILSYIQVLFRVVWVCVGGLVVESCCLALNNIVLLFQGQSDTVTNCRNIRSSPQLCSPFAFEFVVRDFTL